MPASTIAPGVPTVTQGQTIEPVDNSPGLEQVQKAFDQVYPQIRGTPKSQEPPPPPEAKPAEAPPSPVTPPEAPKQPEAEPKAPEAPTPPPETVVEHKLPSFLEEALKGESVKSQQPAPDEWPEELPTFKTPEESKERYKNWRKAYNEIKDELAKARSQPAFDNEARNRVQYLENQNKQMQETLTRMGVQHSEEFNRTIMQPLYGAWNEAARIVRDAGGDPNELARAMSLSGRAQFEALDTIFEGMPESAKTEANDALRQYRRFEDARRNAVANAPKTMEAIRQRETERQYAELNKQREGMRSLFDSALHKLRDEAKVEVFQKSNNPGDQWWNEQGERLINQARDLYLENTDMERVAMACLLAPTADAYRNLFITTQKENQKLRNIIKDKIGSEPVLSESSGNAANLMPDAQLKEDLKLPFEKVFLREFHKSRNR